MQVSEKIARLAAECGWNLETLARQTGLHRNTLRPLLRGGAARSTRRPPKKLHNATLRKCADAFGLTVQELIDRPVEQLIRKVRRTTAIADGHAGRVGAKGVQSVTHAEKLARELEEAGQPELQAWLKRFPDRGRNLTEDDLDELLSLQGTGGALTEAGVEHFVQLLERKRELLRRTEILAGTEYLGLLEQLVGLMWERAKSGSG